MRVPDFGVRVSSSVFRGSGFELRVSGFGFRDLVSKVRDSGFGVRGSGFGGWYSRVLGFGFRVFGFGFRGPASGIRVPGFGACQISFIWAGFSVLDSGFLAQASASLIREGCRLWVWGFWYFSGSGFRVIWGVGDGAWDVVFRFKCSMAPLSGFGFRISSFECRDLDNLLHLEKEAALMGVFQYLVFRFRNSGPGFGLNK